MQPEGIMAEIFHFIQSIVGILAGVAVLYVSNRLLAFRVTLMKELETKFVDRELARERELSHERAHSEIGRTLDRLWRKVFNGGSKE